MSGHSKWSTIKRKKGAADAKRGKLFSKLARAIIVATKEGGADPSANLALQNAVEKARQNSMPKENIERAIARASGEGEGAATFEVVTYEGYGPGGIAVLVEALTDNRNRTAAEVRHIFSKHEGNLGASGAVAWQFDRKAIVLVSGTSTSEDEVLLAAADGGAEDVVSDGTTFQVTAAPPDMAGVRSALEKAGMTIEAAEYTMVPTNTVNVEDSSAAARILRLMDALEDNEDVQDAYSNFDIPEYVMEAAL